jgi:PqqA peptide cyclase
MSILRADLPLAVLAELTHRCPLQCPYCSNPQQLLSARDELSTADWKRVIDQAAELGALQIHFSGGEPMMRRDLDELVGHAHAAGLYGNLITSGVLSGGDRLRALARSGLDHVQLSFQDTDAQSAERIGNYRGAQDKKIAFAEEVCAAGLPLTINVVVHRQNLARLGEMIALALALGAARLEIAHVQYYGWALKNRGALMPTRAQVEAATRTVDEAPGHRLCRPGLLCAEAQGLHGRLGSSVHEHHAKRQRTALSRRRDAAGNNLRQRHGSTAGRYLAFFGCLRKVSRYGLDAGTLPQL